MFFCPKLSRKHATLYFENENFYISDHSTNGTSVTNTEGTKVLLEKNEKHVLHSGDVVSFGDHSCDAINTRIEIIRMESSINNNSLENNNSIIEEQTSTNTKSRTEETINNTENSTSLQKNNAPNHMGMDCTVTHPNAGNCS